VTSAGRPDETTRVQHHPRRFLGGLPFVKCTKVGRSSLFSHFKWKFCVLPPLASGCVLGEDGVAKGFRVARGAGLQHRRVPWLAVFVEVRETPSARGRVLLRVLDHKLNVGGCPGNERVGTLKPSPRVLLRKALARFA